MTTYILPRSPGGATRRRTHEGASRSSRAGRWVRSMCPGRRPGTVSRRGSRRSSLAHSRSCFGFVFPGGNSGEATPVPIPNTEVKLSRADGTAGATLWESRTLPGFFPQARESSRACSFFRARDRSRACGRFGPAIARGRLVVSGLRSLAGVWSFRARAIAGPEPLRASRRARDGLAPRLAHAGHNSEPPCPAHVGRGRGWPGFHLGLGPLLGRGGTVRRRAS